MALVWQLAVNLWKTTDTALFLEGLHPNYACFLDLVVLHLASWWFACDVGILMGWRDV
jgi:hypothetical protein